MTWLWVLAGVTASSLPHGAHGEGTCCGGHFAEGLHLRTDYMKKIHMHRVSNYFAVQNEN